MQKVVNKKVRLRVNFDFETLELPIQYNHVIQGLIYDSIPDASFKHWLHNRGLELGKRSFKLFTFSRLFGQFKIDQERGKAIFHNNAYFYVSSAVDEIIQELGNGFLGQPVNLLAQPVTVREVAILPPPNIGNTLKIKAFSPVVAYRTEKQNNKPYTHYFGPEDPEFNELLAGNLARKYASLHGRYPEQNGFSLKPYGKIDSRNLKIMKFKGIVIKGWMGNYQLEGDPVILKLAYDAGLGSKNAQGFGCFEVI